MSKGHSSRKRHVRVNLYKCLWMNKIRMIYQKKLVNMIPINTIYVRILRNLKYIEREN
jgi:hypothetical protein